MRPTSSWPDRDRFVLSNGHGSMLQYALLCLTGFAGVTLEALKSFRQWGSITPGHPEYGHTPGVETTTGPLGQGIATAVGMAMAERHLNARFGDDLVDHRTWVVCGDGDLMEGVSQEAISLAGRLKLSRLCVLWDDNDITIDGPAALSETGDQLMRFRAAGWMTRRIDGHDTSPPSTAPCAGRQRQAQPVLIACKTQDRQGLGHPRGSPRHPRQGAGGQGGRRNPGEAGLAARRPSSCLMRSWPRGARRAVVARPPASAGSSG